MAYVRKVNGKWRAQVERNGQRASAVWDSKPEAESWARTKEIEFLATKRTGPIFTFGQAADKYGAEVSKQKDGSKWELLRLEAMRRHFGTDTPLSDLDAPQIGAWRDTRLNGSEATVAADGTILAKASRAVSGSTVQREANLLRHVFSQARDEWHWIEHDPFKGVRLPKESEHRHQVWRWQEIKRIVRKLGYVSGKPPKTKLQEVALAFMLSLRTSMRASEVLRISPKTFDPVKRVVVVKAKNMLRSEIPVTRQAARLCKLAKFTLTADSLDVLFRKARGQVLLDDLNFHDARATALTLMARRVDILTLSRISQHKNLKMLQRYYRETSAEIAARI